MIGLSDNETGKENQVAQWLKKLERESWQLELLVSAFTIFLLIQANIAYKEFFDGLVYYYNVNGDINAFTYMFLGLVGVSIKALTLFLVLHLMLRGFWIGAIGLRSVQPSIDFASLNYSEYFTEKLKQKVRSLDDLVMMLDQLCSVIFAFSFLVISMLIAFGMYLLFLGIVAFFLNWLGTFELETLSTVLGFSLIPTILLTGLIYLIDYFTLGFIKKIKWFSKVYYPIYRFYGFITFSGISRSIYYYLITKFSKNRIRLAYLIAMSLWIFSITLEFDQFQYFSNEDDKTFLSNNYYDDRRDEDSYVGVLSIESRTIAGSFMPVWIRSNPQENSEIQAVCPEFESPRNDGWNSTLNIAMDDGSVNLNSEVSDGAVERQMLDCMLAYYRVSINDSVYHELDAFFHYHPQKDQKGILAMLETSTFLHGKNMLKLETQLISEKDSVKTSKWIEVANVPFWFDAK
ncbi:MAG: hypothetical protein R8G66_11910 [Cytophagales bacterium]|nr:hypothetical protein [Cytophagales bacterium]